MSMEGKEMKSEKLVNMNTHPADNQHKIIQAQKAKSDIKKPATQEQPKTAAVSEGTQSESVQKVVVDQKDSKPENAEGAKKPLESTEKKDKRPETISLKNKSDLFKKIINIAIAYEAQVSVKKKLEEKNIILMETCKSLNEEKIALIQQLNESEIRCKTQQNEISELKTEIARRDEAITIVKADKTESAHEYKNALAASLKSLYTDFAELKDMGTSDDVGLAVIEIFEGVLKVLEKNGIVVGK